MVNVNAISKHVNSKSMLSSPVRDTSSPTGGRPVEPDSLNCSLYTVLLWGVEVWEGIVVVSHVYERENVYVNA